MSTVFYRWGAGRDESRVTFDGTHISVFDLKREIILQNKMGNGKDFDIGVYDNVNGEEFKDDNHQIPRSSSLIARRLPSSIKGRGNAQNYIIGTAAGESLTGDHRIEAHARDAMLAKQTRGLRGAGGMFGSMTKRFDGKDGSDEKAPGVTVTTGNADEDARIQAMFHEQEDQWEQDLDDMSAQPRAAAQYRQRQQRPGGPPGGGGGKPMGGKFDYSLPPDKEPPVGYICYRCGQKGHWIQDCPNNEDPAAQDRKRFVRVTGIPRSFLKTVETPIEGEGSSGGAMLTADGGFVRAVPDQRRWQKEVAAKPRTLTNAEVRDQEVLDPLLTCNICKKLVWEAVRTPCCDSAFCEECITSHLVDHSFECPVCESKVASLNRLKPDEELREKVKGYVDGEIERSKKEEKEEKEEKEKNGENVEEGEGAVEGEAVKAEDGTTPQPEADGSQPVDSAQNGVKSEAANSAPEATFDSARMQEMLNPATMQIYLTQMNKMLQNPEITPPNRLLLQNQLQAVNATVLQMQMMAASQMMGGGNMSMGNMGMGMGMGMGIGGGNMGGMGGMMQGNMGMDMGMSMGMNNGMGMGMNNGMGMGQMGMGNNNMGNMGGGMNNGNPGSMGNMGGGGRGRGGFANRGFRGRGGMGFNGPGRGGMRGGMGGPGGQAGVKREAEEVMAGGDKYQRMG